MTDWKQATISNNFMFRLVMEKQELCKPLVERILGIRIQKLSYMEAEKSLETKLSSKGVRLDIYVEDEAGAAYDIEMQIGSQYKEYLGYRTRYYQSMMDNDALKKGELYSKLRKSYIIFICLFDPFDRGWGKYTFNTYCNEDKELQLDDGINRVFINVNGDKHRVSRELANLMDYIATGKVEDEFTGKLESAVESLRADDGKERLYMTFQQTIMEHEMWAEKRGEVKGIEQVAREMLKNNMSVDMIAKLTKMTIAQVNNLVKKTTGMV